MPGRSAALGLDVADACSDRTSIDSLARASTESEQSQHDPRGQYGENPGWFRAQCSVQRNASSGEARIGSCLKALASFASSQAGRNAAQAVSRGTLKNRPVRWTCGLSLRGAMGCCSRTAKVFPLRSPEGRPSPSTLRGLRRAVDIASWSEFGGPARGLFGRHVGGCSHYRAGLGEVALGPGQFREPKIGDAWLIVGIDQHVRGFQVAMKSAVLMRVMDCFSHGFDVGGGPFRRDTGILADPVCQIPPST